MTEADLQSKIIDYLHKQGCEAYKLNASRSGYPDISGCTREGRHIAIEVKAKGKKPEKLQYKKLESLKAHNAICFWCDTWEMFIAELRFYLPECK